MLDDLALRRLFIGLVALQLIVALLNLAFIPAETRLNDAWRSHIESPVAPAPAEPAPRLGPVRELIRFAKQQLDLDRECNFTSWFASMQAGLVGFLALILWLGTGRKGWALVSLGLVFLSFDESCQFHEWFGTYLADTGFSVGALEAPYPWVVVLGPLFLAYAVALLVFLNRELRDEPQLKRATLLGFCLMMAVLPLEAIGGQLQGDAPRPPRLEVIAEETLETLGITLFLYVVVVLVWRRPWRRKAQAP